MARSKDCGWVANSEAYAKVETWPAGDGALRAMLNILTDRKQGDVAACGEAVAHAAPSSPCELDHPCGQASASAETLGVAEFSAAFVHEISQPLAALVINAHACEHWLSGDNPDLRQARETVQRMLRDAAIAADILSEIRSLFGCCEASRCRLDINDVVKEIAGPAGYSATARTAGVVIDLDDTIPRVLANRAQLTQVLANLVRNGEEATISDGHHGPPVLVRTRWLDPGQVLVEVRDHGPGVADPQKAFQPFFSTKTGGMGMGLAVCRLIIEAHGGRIWAGNNLPQGAVLGFVLPGLPDEVE